MFGSPPTAPNSGASHLAATISLYRDPAGLIDAPASIVIGADGALWFTSLGDRIGRITTSGDITSFPVGGGDAWGPLALAPGADGNIWFTTASNQVGRITPTGDVVFFDGNPPEVVFPTHMAAGT